MRATAFTFRGVRAVRGRPDLGASSRVPPDCKVILTLLTVLSDTPQYAAICAWVLSVPAAPRRQPATSVLFAWLFMTTRDRNRFSSLASGHVVN